VPYQPSGHPVHDPRTLRAIAHPVRNRILTELGATGSMRAADLARELGIPANQASFHLRQLAKYGLIEEDPGAGRDKRDRVWRLVSADGVSINLGDLRRTPGGEAAADVFSRSAAALGHAAVDAIYTAEREDHVIRTVNDSAVRLTYEEAQELAGDFDEQELAGDFDELIRSWRQRTRGQSGDRRTYLAYVSLQPHPVLALEDDEDDR
jgi:predicted ArsR family transcriptional regulator